MTIGFLIHRLAAWLAGALVAALALAGCASNDPANRFDQAATAGPSPLQAFADEHLPVAEVHRPVRVCLLATLIIEIETAKAMRLDPGRAERAMGRLFRLQAAVAAARADDPYWRAADMADVTLTFGAVIADLGEQKLVDYLRRGLSLDTVLFGARNVAIDAVKLPGVFRSIKLILADLESGVLTEPAVWAKCDARIERNRALLATLLGVPPSSEGS